jgi:hypothetical protein
MVGITMDWVRILAHITGTVDQELLLRNEYLIVENRILKHNSRPRYGSATLRGLHWLRLLFASVVRPLRKWPM